MSEQALDKNNKAGSNQVASDLDELRASKHIHELPVQTPLNQADLTNASISEATIKRVTRPPAVQQARSLAPPSSEVRHARTSPLPCAIDTKKPETPRAGVFTNPTYRYHGSFVSKLITFFANVLKVFERIFLRLLGARDTYQPLHRPNANRETKEATSPEKEQGPGKKPYARAGSRIHRS